MSADSSSASARWICPHCKEDVPRSALLCPHCREPLSGPGASGPIEAPSAPPPPPAPAKRAESRPEPAAASLRGERKVSRSAPPPPAGSSSTAPMPADEWGEEPPPGRGAESQGALDAVLGWLARNWVEIHEVFSAPLPTPEQRRYRTRVIIAGFVIVLGGVLLARMAIVRPWTGEAKRRAMALDRSKAQMPSSTLNIALPEEPSRAADASQASLGPDDASAASLGPPVENNSGAAAAAAPAAPAPATAETSRSEARIVLETAAGQVERMGRFLRHSSAPKLPPLDPKKPADILPPLRPEDEALKNGSPDDLRRYNDLMVEREDLAIALADRLIYAREAGITAERAATVVVWLRYEAELIDSAEAPGAAPAAVAPGAIRRHAPPIPPGQRPEDSEMKQVLTVLLGAEDAQRVLGLRVQ